ncbi:Polyketide cyclase / dehydrase and lipid transport [Streptomyces sp. YIM 130001]|uniref:SRPBCC family protein n=1 Tax=Streptomyces sp. YIM 130001 TaxID=2259644 RepID=UPI000E649B04|nr:SRPBCC family protein [Streptomyces sp. YIM 130001]RII20803.1 Polyketide cyclase / dehydrase and lipid transport [Streptomyces sp. YIM 130001]
MGWIHNVHEREIPVPAAVVGALLDRLSAADDPIFPVPVWDAMRFDRPLGVGATGGHGPVTYRVTEYEPGRRIRFDGTPPWVGHHEVSVAPLDDGRCRVRHVLEMEFRGSRYLAWAAGIRPVHDTMIEELFDNIERVATGSLAHPVRHSARVRLLRRVMWARPETVAIPERARLIRSALDSPAYEDAYRMPLQPGLPRDPAQWTGILRDAFPVIAHEDGELLLRVETNGVKARASILIDGDHITLSTVAATPSPRARLYWAVVGRVHPFMARTMLRRTHRDLSRAAPSAGERALGSPSGVRGGPCGRSSSGAGGPSPVGGATPAPAPAPEST